MKFFPFHSELSASLQHGISLVLSTDLVDVTGRAQSVLEEVCNPLELLLLEIFDDVAFGHEDHMLQLRHCVLDN